MGIAQVDLFVELTEQTSHFLVISKQIKTARQSLILLVLTKFENLKKYSQMC